MLPSDSDSLSSQHFHFWLVCADCWLGVFVPLPGSGMDFSDFVPWSMGCNYIFTIGSPSYNVQRMLTICFNTSPAGRYCPMVTGYRVPDIYWYLPLQTRTVRLSPDLSTSERIFWQEPFLLSWERERGGMNGVIVPAWLAGEREGGQIQWWENDERRGNQSQRGEHH